MLAFSRQLCYITSCGSENRAPEQAESAAPSRHQTCRRKTQETPPENLRDPIWGISTVGRTSLPYCRPRQPLVNQGNPFKMKGNVTRPADVKRGKLPRKTSGNPYGALAQLVARDIRIVEVRGSTPLCSTRKPCRSKPARFFHAHFSANRSMQVTVK